MSAEQTEKASPRRKQKAEEQGDRAYSRELLTACATLGGVLALGVVVPRWAGAWSASYQQCLALGSPDLWQDDRIMQTVLSLRHVLLATLAPVGLVMAAVYASALLAGVGQQGGLRFYAEALQPKFNRLNPVENLKNVFSLRGISRLAKSLVPAAALLALSIVKIKQQTAIPPMSLARLPWMFTSAYDLLLDAAWISFAWSAVDYVVEWQSWTSRLKMSKQEQRDEYKETEGNPQIRSRIKGLQRQMRRKKLKADVKRATVVITNPTHYAVALSFDFETMDPPKVMAKGRDLLAAQIKDEARWAGVPIVENPPLARSLYRSVEPGQSIPFDLYAAVAAILAYLYRKQVEEKVREQRQRETQAAARASSKSPSSSVNDPFANGVAVSVPAVETEKP